MNPVKAQSVSAWHFMLKDYAGAGLNLGETTHDGAFNEGGQIYLKRST